jgi:hypothetical protein
VDLQDLHANTEEDTTSDQFTPVLCGCRADRCKQREDGANEDGASSTDPVVNGIANPAGTIQHLARVFMQQDE